MLEVKMKEFNSADGYSPSESEEFMSEIMVGYFKSKLNYLKDGLLLRDSDDALVVDLQSLKEPDLNDRATMEEEAALDLKNKERIAKSLNGIDIALEKIKSGDYGYCEESGEPISVMRLDAMPATIYSIEALKKMEKANGNRPL